MLDLSNNNATGHNFAAAHRAGQRRLYLKTVQGVGFVDATFGPLRKQARTAGFMVGGYAFLEPLAATPKEAAEFFLARLPNPLRRGEDLRPCLDVESGTPSAKVGAWATRVADIVANTVRVRPLIYGTASFLEACEFKAAPGPLWLAAYGKDDGHEHPIGQVPKPWTVVAAHQFTDQARVVGINGRCDLSHVFMPGSIDLPGTFQA